MVSRNNDKVTFGLALTCTILGAISVIFTCIGVGLPSWYMGYNSNYSINVAQANLFYSCFLPNVTQSTTNQTCTSFSSYSCSTTSYQSTSLNTTSTISGCINPSNGSSSYLLYDGPIYQVYIEDFYRIRSAAVLAILSILFIFTTAIFALLTALLMLNIYLIFLGPIFSLLGLIFGVCALLTIGSVYPSTGVGYALFIVGILLHAIVVLLLSITTGRLVESPRKESNKPEDQQVILGPSGEKLYRTVRKVPIIRN